MEEVVFHVKLNAKNIDVGYVNVKYVKEGISQWYDGEKMNVYKNTNVVFLKFVHELPQVNNEFLVD